MAGRKVPINTLNPGDSFRFLVGMGRWCYGHLIFANNCRARVVFYDQKVPRTRTVKPKGGGKPYLEEYYQTMDEETNVPRDMGVEPLESNGPTGEGGHMQDDVKAAGLKAKYRYQQKQLAIAQESGQADKIEVCKSRIKQLQQEAEAGKIELPEYDDDRTTHSGPRESAPVADEIENDPAVQRAREKSKAAKEKGLTKKAQTEYKKIDRSAPKKVSATHNCICGCERETGSLYAPGHDARVKGILLKVERGEIEKSAIPEQVVPFVKWSGKWKTENFKLTAAPVKIPGRPEVENTTLQALEALDV